MYPSHSMTVVYTFYNACETSRFVLQYTECVFKKSLSEDFYNLFQNILL